MIVRFEDVITRITGNVDRYNTDLEYYVGGDQYDSSSLTIERRGDLKKDVDILGFKFHFPFKSGDVLLMARNPHLRTIFQLSSKLTIFGIGLNPIRPVVLHSCLTGGCLRAMSLIYRIQMSKTP